MAACIRSCGCRLLSYRGQAGSYYVTRKTKSLFQAIGYKSKPRVVTRIYITDEEECDRYRISEKLIGNRGENIHKLQSEFGSDLVISVLAGAQVYISGNDVEKVDSAAEKVSQEVERIRNLHDRTKTLIKEKVCTDDDVEIHKTICKIMFGNKGRMIRQFVSMTGLEFEVTNTKKQYVFVSGRDSAVVKKAVKLVEQHIKNIRIYADIK